MLRQEAIAPVPNETARVAHAAFPAGHRYLRLADELGTLFTDVLFATLYSKLGQPALPPWRLALVTMLQFAEGLSDRQAAEAVRSRLDWKYLLRLELTDSGFDASVLSEFRSRLLRGDAAYLLFDHLLRWCREHDGRGLRSKETQAQLTMLAGQVVATSRAGAVVGGGHVETAWNRGRGDDQRVAGEVVIDGEGVGSSGVALCYTQMSHNR